MVNENLLNDANVSQILGKSRQTLANRRHLGLPPKYYKIGSHVRYKMSDILEYIESCCVEPLPTK